MHKKTLQKFELRALFKKALEVKDFNDTGSVTYRKLTHFVWVKKLKEQIPGTLSLYMFVNNGILIATNSICINEWLDVHDLPRRREFNITTIEQKIKVNNGDTTIDNRTPQSVVQTGLRKSRIAYANRIKGLPGQNMREEIWKMYADGLTVVDIARIFDVTAPAVHYHINKKQKEVDKSTV